MWSVPFPLFSFSFTSPAGFGGCIRDVRLAASGPVLNLAAALCAAVRVNLDGCLSADTSVNCRGNDSILVYTGNEIGAVDLSLQPFTGTHTHTHPHQHLQLGDLKISWPFDFGLAPRLMQLFGLFFFFCVRQSIQPWPKGKQRSFPRSWPIPSISSLLWTWLIC